MNRDEAIATLEKLERVQVDTVGPSDVLVLTTPRLLTPIDRKRINYAFAQLWPSNRCLVLDGGCELKVVAMERE